MSNNFLPIFKLLKEISNNPDMFDYEIVEMMVKKVAQDLPKHIYKDILYLEKFIVEGNLWANISIKNKNFNEQMPVNNMDLWKEIFEKHCPEILENTSFNIDKNWNSSFNKKDFYPKKISLDLVKYLCNGLNENENNKLKIINKDEEIILILDLLEKEQSYSLTKFLLEKNPEFGAQVCKIIENNKDEIKDIFGITSENFTQRMFNSNALKVILANTSPEHMVNFISDDDLRAIYKKSSTREIATSHPQVLNNLLPLATPEKWLKAFRHGKKEFNILSFFDNKFFVATGQDFYSQNLHGKPVKGKRKSSFGMYKKTREAMTQEFEYLMPGIKKEFISNEKIVNWYRSLISTDFTEVFSLCAEIIEIPTQDMIQKILDSTEDKKSQKFIDNLQILKQLEVLNKSLLQVESVRNFNLKVTWGDIYEEGRKIALSKKIDNYLNVNEEKDKVKIKI